jgi:dihydroorotate dehydrogenase electron transfer subunit
MTAPFGRRACEVTGSRASGGYRVFSLLDREGPEPQPGQFYMLASESHWEQRGGRPYLPRAFSVAEAEATDEGTRLDFLVEGIGPGTDRLCELEPEERVWVNGPLGNSFSPPQELSPGTAGAILVGGGIGIAPLALWRRRLSARNIPARVLLGFRDEAHSGGLDDFFACCEVGLASDDGHAGHHGYVTDLLQAMLEGDDARSAAVYACGPPPMLDAVAALCSSYEVACELAMESPMGCGFGACFGCAVPKGDGTYLRLCIDGPVIRPLPGGGAVGGTTPEEALATAGGGGSPAVTEPARQAFRELARSFRSRMGSLGRGTRPIPAA